MKNSPPPPPHKKEKKERKKKKKIEPNITVKQYILIFTIIKFLYYSETVVAQNKSHEQNKAQIIEDCVKSIDFNTNKKTFVLSHTGMACQERPLPRWS